LQSPDSRGDAERAENGKKKILFILSILSDGGFAVLCVLATLRENGGKVFVAVLYTYCVSAREIFLLKKTRSCWIVVRITPKQDQQNIPRGFIRVYLCSSVAKGLISRSEKRHVL
jgi:hypothetical protein